MLRNLSILTNKKLKNTLKIQNNLFLGNPSVPKTLRSKNSYRGKKEILFFATVLSSSESIDGS